MRALVSLLAAAAADAQTPFHQKAIFEQRPVVSIANDKLELAINERGGAFVNLVLLDDAERLSPLWNPARNAREAGEANRFGVAFGHFVCVDGFGPGSAEEQAAGLPEHGDADSASPAGAGRSAHRLYACSARRSPSDCAGRAPASRVGDACRSRAASRNSGPCPRPWRVFACQPRQQGAEVDRLHHRLDHAGVEPRNIENGGEQAIEAAQRLFHQMRVSIAFGLVATCRSIRASSSTSDCTGWRRSWLAGAKNFDLARLARSASDLAAISSSSIAF